MLLGFKRRFAPFVEDHSKAHTIRDSRAISPGARLDLYVDPRQKSMRLLGRFRCTKVQEITIWVTPPDALRISIDGGLLTSDEVELLAIRDGFRDPGRDAAQQMLDFWRDHDREFPWTGILIHWDPNHSVEK